jgi:hypothetical protein
MLQKPGDARKVLPRAWLWSPPTFAAVEFTPQAVSPLVVLIIGKMFFNEIASNQILTWSGSLGYIDSVFFEPQYKYNRLSPQNGDTRVSSTAVC